MATTKSTKSKKTTTKKTPAKKAPAKKTTAKKAPAKKSTAKTTTKKTTAKKKPQYQSFKLSPEQQPFFTYSITDQTVYWFVLSATVFAVSLWVLYLHLEVVRISAGL